MELLHSSNGILITKLKELTVTQPSRLTARTQIVSAPALG